MRNISLWWTDEHRLDECEAEILLEIDNDSSWTTSGELVLRWQKEAYEWELAVSLFFSFLGVQRGGNG